MTGFMDLPPELQEKIYAMSGHNWWIRHGPHCKRLSSVPRPPHQPETAQQYNVRIRQRLYPSFDLVSRIKLART